MQQSRALKIFKNLKHGIISMAEKLKLQTPASMSGLVRYYEEDKSLIKLKPEHVVFICLLFAAIEIAAFVLTKAPVV